MSEHEARSRAFYDHDEDEPRAPRRRRPVADWGVGEEMFDHMPGRRFERRPGHEPGIPRGGAEDGRRTIRIGEDAEPPPLDDKRPAEPVDEAFASREEALRAREEHEAIWGGDEPFADAVEAPADEPEVRADEPAEPAPAPAVGERAAPHVAPRGEQRDGRRTVRIGGRPGEFATPPRRRPPRTMDERIGSRPDRVAAWAFALGILLILVALLV